MLEITEWGTRERELCGEEIYTERAPEIFSAVPKSFQLNTDKYVCVCVYVRKLQGHRKNHGNPGVGCFSNAIELVLN